MQLEMNFDNVNVTDYIGNLCQLLVWMNILAN